MERVEVLVVGGGQAGLAVGHELGARGIEHVVLERGRIGQTWRDRWDSFCLVTPNWSVQLPGHHYDGSDPDGFMPRDDIVAYLDRYATSADVPVRENVEVAALEPTDDRRFVARCRRALPEEAQVVAPLRSGRGRGDRRVDHREPTEHPRGPKLGLNAVPR